MYTLLLILLIVDCAALMLVVLLQSGKGGGLAAGFGGAGTGIEMMGSRQTATFLHSATKWLGGAFLVISFALSLITVQRTGPRSLIETEMQRQQQQAPAQEGAPAGSPTDLQDILEGGEGGATEPAPQGGEAQPDAGTTPGEQSP